MSDLTLTEVSVCDKMITTASHLAFHDSALRVHAAIPMYLGIMSILTALLNNMVAKAFLKNQISLSWRVLNVPS